MADLPKIQITYEQEKPSKKFLLSSDLKLRFVIYMFSQKLKSINYQQIPCET